MRLVVDTNVIFSALIAGGKTRELIITADLELYVPEYFFTELMNNKDTVQEKTGLDRRNLDILLNLLFESIHIVPKEEFEDQLSEATDVIGDTDPDDVPFLALARHLDADIWSDDQHFQEQDIVTTWKTHELIDHLDL
jgi:predicted nucleic acid-binding protein